MGVTLGDAILFLRGDQTQLDKDLHSAETKTKSLFGRLAGSANKLIGGAIVGGAVLATTAVVGIGAAAFGVSSDMRDATNEIRAQLGATEADAKQLGEVAKNVWKNNFGGSIEEATQAVITARKQLGDLSDNELHDAAENAFRLSDAFGIDVSESLSAVRTLTEEFGLSQQEAFDLLASGFQKGLNSSGDFIDTIGEYSNLFVQSGADAGEFFSLMESGLAGGVLGTDKAADAFKEFQIRFIEGNEDLKGGLETLGLSYDDLRAGVESGNLTIADAFQQVVSQAGEVDMSVLGNQEALAKLGTQFEDMGAGAVAALNLTTTKLDDLAGATDKIDALYDNWPSMWEGVKRNALAALTPLGDKLLALANDMMPQVQAAFDWLSVALPPAIDWVVQKFSEFYAYIQTNVLPILQQMGDWLINEGIPAYIEFITPIVQQVVPGLQLLAQIGLNLASVVWPMLVQATQFVIDNWGLLEPIVIAVGVAILALTSPVTLVAGLIVTLATAWANNWGDIQGKTKKVIDFVRPYIETAMEAISAVVEAVTGYMSEWWGAHGDNVMLIIRTVFDFIKARIEERIRQVQSIIQAIGTAIRIFWDAWGTTLIELARLAWDNIVTIIKAAMDLLGFIIDAVAALIRGDWEAFGEALKNIWQTIWNTITQVTQNKVDAIELVLGNLKQIWGDIWEAIRAAASEKINAIVDKISEFTGKVEDIWDDFVDGLKDSWEDAWDDIVDYVEDIVDNITDAINDIIDAIKDLFDIDLPSLPGFGGWNTGGRASNSYNLTLNTSASASSVIGEFEAMKATIGT